MLQKDTLRNLTLEQEVNIPVSHEGLTGLWNSVPPMKPQGSFRNNQITSPKFQDAQHIKQIFLKKSTYLILLILPEKVKEKLIAVLTDGKTKVLWNGSPRFFFLTAACFSFLIVFHQLSHSSVFLHLFLWRISHPYLSPAPFVFSLLQKEFRFQQQQNIDKRTHHTSSHTGFLPTSISICFPPDPGDPFFTVYFTS